MSSEKFREFLVKMVKASGQEIIDRAEDLVGDGDLISDFNIRIRFSVGEGAFSEIPTIEVSREHCIKQAIDVLMEKDREHQTL